MPKATPSKAALPKKPPKPREVKDAALMAQRTAEYERLKAIYNAEMEQYEAGQKAREAEKAGAKRRAGKAAADEQAPKPPTPKSSSKRPPPSSKKELWKKPKPACAQAAAPTPQPADHWSAAAGCFFAYPPRIASDPGWRAPTSWRSPATDDATSGATSGETSGVRRAV